MEAKRPKEEREEKEKKAVVEEEEDKRTVSSASSSPHTVPSSPRLSFSYPRGAESKSANGPPVQTTSQPLEPEKQREDDSDSPPHAVGSPANSLSSDHSSISRVSSPREEKGRPSRPLSPAEELGDGLANATAIGTASAPVVKVDWRPADGAAGRPRVERGDGGGSFNGGGRRLRPDLSILKRTRRESMVKRALLVFRVCGFVSCLVAFSVMAADRNQGWAVDSFYRYKEFRFCLAVNAIGFIYSGFQAYDLAYFSATGKHMAQHWHRLRPQVDFFLDQMISYLLISAISSSATRVEDWQANWGKDKFPQMATASVAVTILAFVAFALSSVISGYTFCTLRNTY